MGLPVLTLVGILAGAAAFRAYHLGSECFDCDELYAVRIHGLSVRNVALVMARDSFHTNHPFLMTVPYLFWEELFGVSEFGVRSLPMLLGVAAVALAYLTGKELGGRRAGLFAAGTLAINPLHIAYSQEARQYAMLVFLVMLAHWAFLRLAAEAAALSSSYISRRFSWPSSLITLPFRPWPPMGSSPCGSFCAATPSADVRPRGYF